MAPRALSALGPSRTMWKERGIGRGKRRHRSGPPRRSPIPLSRPTSIVSGLNGFPQIPRQSLRHWDRIDASLNGDDHLCLGEGDKHDGVGWFQSAMADGGNARTAGEFRKFSSRSR